MKNVYSVRLDRPVPISQTPHFSGKETSHLFVVATSYAAAIEAVERKYYGVAIKGIDLMNYSGIPIVVGE